jgi:ketosteroid isomerase-like protein
MTTIGSPEAVRAFVRDLMQAMLAGDLEEMRARLTDDVVWHVPPSSAPQFSSVVGIDTLLDFVRRAAGLYYEPGSLRMEPVLEAAEGDRCLVLTRIRARTRTGRDYENLYAFGFRLREGRAYEIWELLDTAHFRSQTAS